MNRKILALGATMVAASGLMPAAAQPAGEPKPERMVERKVVTMAAPPATRAEVQAMVTEHFSRMDANRDGFVTREEARSAMPRMHEQMASRMAERHGGPAPDRGAMFDRLDTNKDGSISREEFTSAAPQREVRVMRIVERDGSGAAPARMMRMGAMMHGRMFESADTDKDGRVSLQEMTAAALGRFDRIDRNRDGRVTPEERIEMRRKIRTERKAS